MKNIKSNENIKCRKIIYSTRTLYFSYIVELRSCYFLKKLCFHRNDSNELYDGLGLLLAS